MGKERQSDSVATVSGDDGGPVTQTMSTRVSVRQRELIDQAAALSNVSPAKFIREAAIDRAADVVNASGEELTALRQLARVVTEHLQNPRLVTKWIADGPEDGANEPECDEMSWVELQASDVGREMEFMDRDRHEEGYSCLGTEPKRPTREQLDQIKSAFDTAGTEFVRMILEAWSSAMTQTSAYHPKVSKDRIRSETSDE